MSGFMHYNGPAGAGDWIRKLRIGATVVLGQIVISDTKGSAPIGEVTDPASVNDYTGGVGVVVGWGKPSDSADCLAVSSTQGTGSSSADHKVEVSCFRPGTLYAGKVSGGVTADTAFAAALNGNILLTTGASAGGIVITDSNVGTSEYAKGEMVGLSGANKGFIRQITSHIDNTSETVSVPFDYAIATGDYFFRGFGGWEQGYELTTSFTQFNGKTGAGVDLPDTGDAVIVFMEYDMSNVDAANGKYPTARAVFTLVDAAMNPVAA